MPASRSRTSRSRACGGLCRAVPPGVAGCQKSRLFSGSHRSILDVHSALHEQRIGGHRAATAGMPANILPCAFWPHRPVEPPVKVTAQGERNILIVQNLRDPTTSWASARGLRSVLGRRAAMVTVDAGGHGVYPEHAGACAGDLVTEFLVTGVLPSGDRFCAGPAPNDRRTPAATLRLSTSCRPARIELAADGITVSAATVGQRLVHPGINRRRHLDPTGESNRPPRRITARCPGDMVRLDVKKSGGSPTVAGLRPRIRPAPRHRPRQRRRRPCGYVYLHSAVDGSPPRRWAGGAGAHRRHRGRQRHPVVVPRPEMRRRRWRSSVRVSRCSLIAARSGPR